MHIIKIITGIAVATLFTLLMNSCLDKAKTVEPYMISIDSLSAPDTVLAKTLFDIKLYGIVGPNNCYAYEKSYSYINDNYNLIIEAWGRYAYDGVTCVDGLVLMDATFEASLPSAGTYLLRGVKSDGIFAEKTIIVK